MMSADIVCYNCGGSLATLTLPLSRRDMCPACSVHVHVCRMCTNYDPAVIGQCREEDAEEVLEKTKVNFCDWFSPAANAYDASRRSGQLAALANAEAPFGDGDGSASADSDALSDAENLFK